MIHRLNQYFIDKMRETAYAMFPDTMSSVPNFPACMVYLNPAALKRNEVITQRLRRVWRGSVSDICCYQAVPIKGGCRFCHTDGKEADLLSEVQRMSSSNTKFYNPAKLNVYCILDTSDLKDMNALLFCINMACYFKQVVRMPNVQLFLMAIVDESLRRIDFAAQIRGWMRSNYDNLCRNFDSICLISNRCGNNATLDDYEISLVVSSAILLTNTHDDSQQVRLQALTSSPMFTLSYIEQQKPVEEIGWVVLKSMADFFCDQNAAQYTEPTSLPQLLGISSDGSFLAARVLEDELMRKLPREDEFEHFARLQSFDTLVTELSYAEFNQLTMGGFDDFLKQQLSCDPQLFEKATAAYREYISEHVSIAKLAGLSESAVRAVFFDSYPTANQPHQTKVMQAVRSMIRSRCTESVRKTFYQVVCESIAKAKSRVEFYQEMRSKLLSDFNFVNPSPNVVPYYTEILQRYLETAQISGQQLKLFYQLNSTEEQIEQQMKRLIDDIIATNRCFYASFDEELKMRIGAAALAALLGSIKNNLLGHNTGDNACWNTPYGMTRSYQGIMMNLNQSGSMLYQTFQMMLQKENVDYFNTGSSDAIESVALFPLTRQHLYGSNEHVEKEQTQEGGAQ